MQLEELENTEATDADELERQSMQARHCYLTIYTHSVTSIDLMTYTHSVVTLWSLCGHRGGSDLRPDL